MTADEHRDQPPSRARSTDRRGWWVRKAVRGVTIVAIVIGGLSAVLLSPLLLTLIGAANGVDWNRVREVSQTYGATSVILSTLAIGGVAVSLFLQAQQARASRLEAIRRYQLELVRMALDDPATFMPCIGQAGEPPATEARQRYYTVLWMQFSRMGYEQGAITEASLRNDNMPAMFRSEIGRDYWAKYGSGWDQLAGYSRRTRRFIRIVHQEYARAVAAGPPAVTRSITRTPRSSAPARRGEAGPRRRASRLGLALESPWAWQYGSGDGDCRTILDDRPTCRPSQFREACVRCSLLRPDPEQRPQLEEIRDNLASRIIEGKCEGWLGEVEGLRVSLTGERQDRPDRRLAPASN